VKKCIHPEDREMYEKYIDKVLKKHIIDPIEYRIVLPNGLSRDIWADGEFVYDKNGTPIKMIGSIQDITERRIAFETLRESERKYRTIFEKANDGIVILDEKGSVLDVNDQVVKIFGFPKEDIISKHFTKLGYFGVNIPRLIKDFHKLLKLPEGENIQFEIEAKNSDGRKIFIEASPTLIRKNNKIDKVQVMVRDITERKEAEAVVQKTFESLRRERAVSEVERNKTLAIVSNLIDPIIVLDKDNKITLINPATREILGLTDGVFGQEVSNENNYSINNFKDIIKKDYKVNVKEGTGEEDILQEELTIEYRGEELTFKVSTAKVIDNKGEYLGVMKLFYNMTQEKMVEKLKSEFITVAAHQFRTPLSATKWVIKMVLDGDAGELSQEQQRFLLQGYRSNERVIKLVNDMLNASRIEEGRFGYVFKKEDLHEIIEAAQKHVADLAKEKEINIKVYIPIGLPPLEIDKEKILLVFQGLLDNAIKYTPQKGKIDIHVDQEVNQARIKVKDTGVGIPQKEQGKVFSKFFRATNVVRMETDGSGLGLFIAKNIIEKHGGKMTYKSEEGKGTEFDFTIPIEQPGQK
jgi:two-component system phosphate regulon sensor histidine kinase PhoR